MNDVGWPVAHNMAPYPPTAPLLTSSSIEIENQIPPTFWIRPSDGVDVLSSGLYTAKCIAYKIVK